VRVLLEAGADVNVRETTRGQTALMWAAAEGHAAVIRLLVKHGSDIHAVSHPPSTQKRGGPRVMAITEGRSTRVDTFTPLQFAVRGGHVEAVKALLDGGASIDEEAPGSMSLLALAILNLHFDAAALLVERGADVNHSRGGLTALHALVQARTPTIGAFPPPQPPGTGSTSMDIAKLLLKHGADIDARAGKAGGSTAFLMAAKGADYQMMRLLAANGASVTAVNARGTNAIALAAGVEMTNPNEDSGTDPDSFQALKFAIALGAGDISAANNDGDTPVHGAIFRQTTNNIRLLAEHGSKLDGRNKRGVLAIEDARNGIPGANNSRRTPKPEAAKVLYDLMVARGLNPPDPNVDLNRYNFGVKRDAQ
jgi:ankyrin repeat protein